MNNSPVNHRHLQQLSFNKNLKDPIYIQIAQQLILLIQKEILQLGEKLPGTREFAQLVNVNRNTAVKVFEELASQGWLEILPNKGTFIRTNNKNKYFKINETITIGSKYEISFESKTHLISPYEVTSTGINLTDGQPDIRLHDTNNYSRWYASVLKRNNISKNWNNVLGNKNLFFEQQLCNYINASRKIHTTVANITTTKSNEMSLYLLTQILLQPNDVVLVGELSHFKTNMVLQQANAHIKTIPLINDQLDINYIRNHFKPNEIKCLYLNTNCYYPTTKPLNTENRILLLQLAQELNFFIIEDDTDFDFQYSNHSTLPLIASHLKERIIYLGSVGKTLYPTLETHFILGSEKLMQECKNFRNMIDPYGDLIKEQIVAEMIIEGELHRQTKKQQQIYFKRLQFCCDLLVAYFKNICTFNKPNSGLALFIHFNQPISLIKWANLLKTQNITVPLHNLYQTKSICAFRFDFSQFNEDETQFIIKELKSAYIKIKG